MHSATDGTAQTPRYILFIAEDLISGNSKDVKIYLSPVACQIQLSGMSVR